MLSRCLPPVALAVLLGWLGGAAPALAIEAEAALGLDVPVRAMRVPARPVPTLQGAPLNLHAQQGRLLLVNFWAPDCASCARDLAALRALAGTYAGRDLRVLTVAQGADRATARGFAREHGLELPVLLDPEETLSDAFGARGAPITFLVARDGRIVRRALGPRQWDGTAAHEVIEAWLAAPPGGEPQTTRTRQ